MELLQKSYLEEYNLNIAPKLKEIDLFIKTETTPLTIEKISRILYLSKEEVETIIAKIGIESLNTYTFFEIMKNGSSDICQLFQRELSIGTPKYYTAEDISFIYNIDLNLIENACQKIGKSIFTSQTLPTLFSNIILI